MLRNTWVLQRSGDHK